MEEIPSNNISVCYSFDDSSHSMDAFVFANCQWELLKLAEFFAEELDIKIRIETYAIEEGSVLQRIGIYLKKNSSTIGGTIITGAIMLCLNGFSDWIKEDSELKKIQKANIEADTELKKAETEKALLETECLKTQSRNDDQLKNKIEELLRRDSVNTKVKKRISNFYENALKEPKIQSISIDNHIEKQIIVREEFNNYILTSDDLDPEIVEDAIIEIVSPVLKKGAYKWRGIYKGEQISFYMKSNEFKTKVQTGDIVFKNGYCIKGELEIERKIDNSGEIKIVSYSINQVVEYITNDRTEETQEGRIYRQKKKVDKSQLDFFSDISENEN